MSTATASKQHGARRIPRYVIVLALALLLVLGAWFGIRARGSKMRTAALDRIQLAQEPLMPAYLALDPAAKGKDPTEWLERIARVRVRWDMNELSNPSKYEFLLGEARANRVGEEGRIAFEKFEQCIRPLVSKESDPNAVWNQFWVGLAVRLRECDGTSSWGDCTENAVKLLAAGLAPAMDVARQSVNYGAIDPLRATSTLDQQDAGFPALPVAEDARLADAVHMTALSQAQSKRGRDALDSVRVGLAVARVHAPSHWLVEEVLWSTHMTRTLEVLQTILPMLPRGLDVTDIEAALLAARPRDEIGRALRGERTFGNRVFEMMREGWRPKTAEPYAPGSMLSRIQRWLVGDADQAAYLDAMTIAIAQSAKSPFVRKPVANGVESSFWTPSAAIIAPNVDGAIFASDVLEARLALARVALTAYRGGAKDALTFLTTSADPFDGQPIKCGFGEGGLVVFWSVGPNGKDEGAKPGTDDIVWGLRLSE